MSEQDSNKINELVDMLDKLMSDGGSHVKIVTDESFEDGTINVHTTNTSECCCSACQIPNLSVGTDNDNNDNKELK